MAPNQVNPLRLDNRPGLLEAPLEMNNPAASVPPYNVTPASVGEEGRVRKRRDAEMVVRAETYTDKDGRKHKFVNMVRSFEVFKQTFSCYIVSK